MRAAGILLGNGIDEAITSEPPEEQRSVRPVEPDGSSP
jgi:hypothetical protein